MDQTDQTPADEMLAAALGHHRAGQLSRAEQIYRQVLQADPQRADAWHLLGMIAHQNGQYETAVEYIGRAAALKPQHAELHLNLGRAFSAHGDLDQAVASFRRAAELDPHHAAAQLLLGNALCDRQQPQEAADCYRRVLSIRPQDAVAHANLGIVLKDLGRFDEAVASCRTALQLKPDYVEAYNNLGVALRDWGRPQEALAAYGQALRIRPDYLDAQNNLGIALHDLGRLDEAVAVYRRALEIRPDSAEVYANLANALTAQGDLDDAVAAYRKSLQLRPEFLSVQLSLANAFSEQGRLDEAADRYREGLRRQPDQPLWEVRLAALCPRVFDGSGQIDRYRRDLMADLKRLAGVKLPADPLRTPLAGCEPPYNLLFHGLDDRPIKEAYAAVFRDCFAGQRPPQQDPADRRERPRIGFVVTARHQRIFLRCMRGILERISNQRFELMVVCPSSGAAMVRAAIRNREVRVLAVADRFGRAVDAIRRERFDLLHYWEVGSDATNYFLPFCRPAPIQCTAWGIPATCGIPQMDYYLSSKLVEPEDADGHYSETLLRASTLLTYQERVDLGELPKRREDLGFSGTDHLYVCAGNPGKLHPDFDPLLAEILRRDGRAVLAVTADRYGRAAEQLRGRFAATIAEVAGRIVFLPWQEYPGYLSLLAAADVLLDPLYFGGAVTAYDAFSVNRPIVTLPGRFRRGRYVSACYRKMQVTDCIAADREDYIEKAVRLGTDAEYRQDVVERIAEAGGVLFEDPEAVREFERLLREMIQHRTVAGPQAPAWEPAGGGV